MQFRCRFSIVRDAHGRTILRERGRGPQARRRAGVPRRGHPRHHQGPAAVGRGLCRGIPRRADLASDGCAVRRAGHPGRPRRPLRDQRQRGDGRRDARGLGHVSHPRRRHLQVAGRHQRGVGCAGQPGLGRRHRRRPDHRRRGLRRGLLDHAGAQPRLRHEIPDLAARSPARSRKHRARRRGRLRAVGGVEHAGHAGSAHPRLPRARQLPHQDQPAAGDEREGRARGAAARYRPHRPAARLLRA